MLFKYISVNLLKNHLKYSTSHFMLQTSENCIFSLLYPFLKVKNKKLYAPAGRISTSKVYSALEQLQNNFLSNFPLISFFQLSFLSPLVTHSIHVKTT